MKYLIRLIMMLSIVATIAFGYCARSEYPEVGDDEVTLVKIDSTGRRMNERGEYVGELTLYWYYEYARVTKVQYVPTGTSVWKGMRMPTKNDK